MAFSCGVFALAHSKLAACAALLAKSNRTKQIFRIRCSSKARSLSFYHAGLAPE
jgi:hypothetical protein